MLAAISRHVWGPQFSTFTIKDPPWQEHDCMSTCQLTVPLTSSLVLPVVVKVSEITERIIVQFSSSRDCAYVDGKQISGENFTVTVQEPKGAFLTLVHFPQGSYLYSNDEYKFSGKTVTFFFSLQETSKNAVDKFSL